MKNLSSHAKALIAVFIAVILGGGISTFSKIALQIIPPFSFSFLRFFIALIFILPLFLKEKPKIDKDFWIAFLISTFATLNIILFAFGVRITQASVAQVIHGGIPIIVAIFSYFILKEKFSSKKIAGLSIGLFGVVFIILNPNIMNNFLIKNFNFGNILVLLSAISFSLYSVLSKKLHLKHTPVFLLTVYVLNTALVSLLLAFFDFVKYPFWFKNLSLISIGAVFYTGFFGAFLFYLLYHYAIKYGSPVIASVSLYLSPIAAIIWAFFLLGEKLTLAEIVGGILALTGAYIVTKKN